MAQWKYHTLREAYHDDGVVIDDEKRMILEEARLKSEKSGEDLFHEYLDRVVIMLDDRTTMRILSNYRAMIVGAIGKDNLVVVALDTFLSSRNLRKKLRFTRDGSYINARLFIRTNRFIHYTNNIDKNSKTFNNLYDMSDAKELKKLIQQFAHYETFSYRYQIQIFY